MFGPSERISDNDYVTHDEINERLQEMEVHGDGNTIYADKQSGGTTLSCTIPVSADTQPEDNPIFISVYNSSTSEYEISWRDFDVQFNPSDQPATTVNPHMESISAGTFKFEKALVFSQIILDIYVATLDGAPELYWTIQNNTGTPSDDFTADRRAADVAAIGTQIQRFTRPIDYPSDLGNPRQIEYVNDGIFYIDNGYDYEPSSGTYRTAIAQFITPGAIAAGFSGATSWTVAASFSSYLIVGWTSSTDTFTADTYANRFSYTDYRIVAFVYTDADKILRKTILYGRNVAHIPMGFSGNWNDGTQTVYAKNGRITKTV